MRNQSDLVAVLEAIGDDLGSIKDGHLHAIDANSLDAFAQGGLRHGGGAQGQLIDPGNCTVVSNCQPDPKGAWVPRAGPTAAPEILTWCAALAIIAQYAPPRLKSAQHQELDIYCPRQPAYSGKVVSLTRMGPAKATKRGTLLHAPLAQDGKEKSDLMPSLT